MLDITIDVDNIKRELNSIEYVKHYGKVTKIVGLTIESTGPKAQIGELCKIHTSFGKEVTVEVVGFKDKKTLLMPYDAVDGISLGSMVENTNEPMKVKVSKELLGMTLDGLGRPLDGARIRGTRYPIEATAPDPMSRAIIDEVLSAAE